MTEQHPDRDAYATTGVLEARCPECGAAPQEWCVDDGGQPRRIPCVGRLAAAVRALRGGDADPNPPDPVAEAFRNYRRPPPDRVAPSAPKPAADVAALAHTPTMTTHLTPDGPFTERVTVAKPIMPKTDRGERNE
ncbi:hypothetical protein [Mycobacterium paraintracellulare]|uniref:hypothetical protein n=1 Tax=Mycobacterium paraintracellulare TaxID=1138383 RepID=UPI001916BBA2|nr:hypothetical protein [Mycobacterium paraintracellulare]BCP06111.1 hypothetical protein MINTM019_35670 [Mycobacterium paraintracellulare]